MTDLRASAGQGTGPRLQIAEGGLDAALSSGGGETTILERVTWSQLAKDLAIGVGTLAVVVLALVGLGV